MIPIAQQINLTSYADNPHPKYVGQLAIVHEAKDGEIVQYYIDEGSHTESDKASTALSVPVMGEHNTIERYDYVEYDTLIWNTPSIRMSRQRIDRLGVKAFPNVGAIAHYKLAYRNLSRIVAPVNYSTKKYQAPTLRLDTTDTSIIFTITPPEATEENQENVVTYLCYRVYMQWKMFYLEYVTYERSLTVEKPDTTGTYACWCVGYVNEGEAVSENSNIISLFINGSRDDWPNVTPGSEDRYLMQMNFDDLGYLHGTISNGLQIVSDNAVPRSGSGGGGSSSGATVLYGTAPPASNLGTDGTIYIQYEVLPSGAPNLVAEWIRINGVWLVQDSEGSSGNVYNIVPDVLNGRDDPLAENMYEGQQYIQYGDSIVYKLNGITITPIPEDDTRPYKWLRQNSSSEYELVTADVPGYQSSSHIIIAGGSLNKISYRISVDNLLGDWALAQNTSDSTWDIHQEILWSSYDIMANSLDSETVYFLGTEPDITVLDAIIASWYKLNGIPQPMQVSQQYQPIINYQPENQGITFWRIIYYDEYGDNVLKKEYVEVGDDATFVYGTDEWALSPGGTAVEGVKKHITENKVLFFVGEADVFTGDVIGDLAKLLFTTSSTFEERMEGHSSEITTLSEARFTMNNTFTHITRVPIENIQTDTAVRFDIITSVQEVSE